MENTGMKLHRTDKGTSGVLALLIIADAFPSRQARKEG